jgi:hypothetical protein
MSGMLMIPLGYLEVNMPKIMENIYPEMMLYLLFLKIAVVTIIDMFVVVSATVILLVHREKGSASVERSRAVGAAENLAGLDIPQTLH